MLVMYQSYLKREDEVVEKTKTVDKDKAGEKSKGIFRIVHEKAQRFVTRMSEREDSASTPMDWIYDTRTYGMKIQYVTAA